MVAQFIKVMSVFYGGRHAIKGENMCVGCFQAWDSIQDIPNRQTNGGLVAKSVEASLGLASSHMGLTLKSPSWARGETQGEVSRINPQE